MRIFLSSLIIFVAIATFSCDGSRVYETNKNIDKALWATADSLLFDFEISEGAQAYNLLYNVRYSKDYPYYNLYLRHTLYDSTGTVLTSEMLNMDLFDAKTGDPMGRGMGDVFDHKILFMPRYSFPYEGKYTLGIKQYMRDEPLKGLQAIGLRIEKEAE